MIGTTELAHDLKTCSLRVYSWNPRSLELCIALEDGEHQIQGLLSFDDVKHFCMPSTLDANRIEIHAAGDLGDDFWCSVSIRKHDFTDESSFFVFTTADGTRYFVAARDMSYERQNSNAGN